MLDPDFADRVAAVARGFRPATPLATCPGTAPHGMHEWLDGGVLRRQCVGRAMTVKQKVVRAAAEVILVRALTGASAAPLEWVQEALTAAVRYHDDPDATVSLQEAQEADEAVCEVVGELVRRLVEEHFDDVPAIVDLGGRAP